MADAKDTKARQPDRKPRCGILIELDHVVAQLRALTFDACKEKLKAKGVSASPFQLSRFGPERPLSQFIAEMASSVQGGKAAANKVGDEIRSTVLKRLTDGSARLPHGLKSLVDAAPDQQAAVGGATSLDPETCEQLIRIVGLMNARMEIETYDAEEMGAPSMDVWLRLAQRMATPPSACMAIVSGAASCHAALAAGMHCTVMPDRFTEFQDLGGADFVVASLTDVSAEALFRKMDISR